MTVVLLIWTVLLCLLQQVTGCSAPLGMMTGQILDWQIAASSSYPSEWDDGCHVKYARLHEANGRAWCARYKSPNEWLLVDLGVLSKVTGIITQGRGDNQEWVTSYAVSYSQDAYQWSYVTDLYGNKKVFRGNSDSHSLHHSYLAKTVDARFVRIHVLDWHKHPSMRVEIIGCQECNQIISHPPYTSMSASSHGSWKRRHSCEPEDGSIYSSRAWCARRQDGNQWLQLDIGPPRLITGIITKGRGDRGKKHWVKSYTLSYSNDSVIWYYYKDANHLDPKIFGANFDKRTERRHYFNLPMVARHVRIHPVTWNQKISMRAALIGCPQKGPCGPGFVRVNEDAGCVENLAYEKKTWVNDNRHTWQDWQLGHSSLVVDGDTSDVLSRCAVLDNYYVDYPIWMIDLGRKRDVSGVIIVTWQGKGQDKSTLYRDYVYNLERLTVYVETRPRLEALDTPSEKKCATVTRMNNAVFQPRLHLECPRPIHGRFVYIRAGGVPNRWNKLYKSVICEVMVY